MRKEERRGESEGGEEERGNEASEGEGGGNFGRDYYYCCSRADPRADQRAVWQSGRMPVMPVSYVLCMSVIWRTLEGPVVGSK